MQTDSSSSVILGVDPGTIVMGYGLLAVGKGSPVLVEMGVLRLGRNPDHAERLQTIFETMQRLIRTHRPSALAIEAPFFGKNVQSMLKLGRAQGVAMAAAMVSGLTSTEYSPRTVKQAVTGRGNATKEQVRTMLEQTLRFESEAEAPIDATDALAVALCHHYQTKKTALGLPATGAASSLVAAARRNRSTGSASSAWESFAKENPNRVR